LLTAAHKTKMTLRLLFYSFIIPTTSFTKPDGFLKPSTTTMPPNFSNAKTLRRSSRICAQSQVKPPLSTETNQHSRGNKTSRTSRSKRRSTSSGVTDVEDIGNSKKRNIRRNHITEPTTTTEAMPPLINLGKLVRGTLLKRPSTMIKSPYVADVTLLCPSKKKDSESGATVLAHAPALHVGGLCSVGAEVYMSERPEGGKTSHAIELVRTSGGKGFGDGVLVGAHPRLGELIALEVLKRGLLKDEISLGNGFSIGPVDLMIESKTKQQVKERDAKLEYSRAEYNDNEMESETLTNARKSIIHLKQQATLGDSRVDFEMSITDPVQNINHRVIFEVKNVVCADYEKGTEPEKKGDNHCVIVAPASNGEYTYRRTALFPWSRSRSQTFEGKKVCSERALKHLRNLESLMSDNVTTVVLFIVNRADCESMRACHEACPVFKETLESVVKSGVKALGVRVKWSDDGKCFFDGFIPVRI